MNRSDGKGIFGFFFGSSQRTILIAIIALILAGVIHIVGSAIAFHGFLAVLFSTEFISDLAKEFGVALLIAVLIVLQHVRFD